MPSQPNHALRFVLLVGLASLFADMTYEAARSIIGPYLAILGAGATVVGIVAGLGELIGYGLRIVSGVISDRTHRYWAITIAGCSLPLHRLRPVRLKHCGQGIRKNPMESASSNPSPCMRRGRFLIHYCLNTSVERSLSGGRDLLFLRMSERKWTVTTGGDVMIFPHPIEGVDAGHLDILLANRVPESRHLDYKESVPGSSDGDKRELLADVSAFANSVGGDLSMVSEKGVRKPGSRYVLSRRLS